MEGKHLITVIIPYCRQEGADRCAAAAHKNAGIDESMFDVFAAYDAERIGCPRMVKAMVDASAGQMVCFLADDTVPQPGYLKHALDVMAEFEDGWGLVGLNDGMHDGQVLAGHWLGHKRLLPRIGGDFFFPGYYHSFCDNELMIKVKKLNRYKWAEKARVDHYHPMNTDDDKRGEWDSNYKRVYSPRYRIHDTALFFKRRSEGFPT
jgi:hypothetical protein